MPGGYIGDSVAQQAIANNKVQDFQLHIIEDLF
jgi:hypothetical protein